MSHPLISRQEDLERQPMVVLVTGETGVGKSYQNHKEMLRYVQDMPRLGKKGRPVLPFDNNDKDYAKYRSISPDHLHLFKSSAIRRIRPFNPDGSPMSNEEKKEVVKKIVKHFRGGLVVLDDVDHYMVRAKGQDLISALVSVRHLGLDLLFTHQSCAKITTSAWEASTYVRFHHQVDNIARYKTRIPNYPIIRIAQLIVNEQYDAAVQAQSSGQISKKEAMIYKSFFVYVNTRTLKITGCTKPAFIRAAIKFINQEETTQLRTMMNEWTYGKNSKKKYKNRNEAVNELLSQYLRFYDPLKPNLFHIDQENTNQAA